MIDSRVLPETTAKGMRPCCALMCSSTSGTGLRCGQLLEVEILFALGDGFDWHIEPVHLVQRGDNLNRRLAAPRIEELFIERAAPLAQRLLPGDVVERHGVDDGAVAVEEIGAKVAGGQLEASCEQGIPMW